MSHTPGPWKVQEFSTQTYMISTFQNGLIAQHVPGEANARLIAAAPELYEALKDLFEAVVIPEDISIEAGVKARIQARDILAKVRGEEIPK